MAHIRIFACPSDTTMSSAHELPSPTDITGSSEQIWSEDTGRAQSGSNQAMMIGKSITSKQTYSIQWDVLATDKDGTASQKLDKIRNSLTRGFFKFGMSIDNSVPSGYIAYRSEIQYSVAQAGNEAYYKDVSVQVIER